MSNVPDDWNCYYRTCELCGSRYHESEGGCDCYEERRERAYEDLLTALHRAVKIETEYDTWKYSQNDRLMDTINAGDRYVTLFVVLSTDYCGRSEYDEHVLTLENWANLSIDLQKRSIGCELTIRGGENAFDTDPSPPCAGTSPGILGTGAMVVRIDDGDVNS